MDRTSQSNGGVLVRVVRPQSTLQSYVTFFYFIDAREPLTDFLYPEWGNIRFALSGEWSVQVSDDSSGAPQSAVLFGPTDRRATVRTTGGKTFGFGLTPLGWSRLIDSKAGQMANRVVPVANLLGVPGETLRTELAAESDPLTNVDRLETLLYALLDLRQPVSKDVLVADAALRMRPTTVSEFAKNSGMSGRKLHRLCLRSFGFAPKRLLRLQRFMDTLGRIRTAVGEPVPAAVGSSYYDQSHFYRDFRDFMAMTPFSRAAASYGSSGSGPNGSRGDAFV